MKDQSSNDEAITASNLDATADIVKFQFHGMMLAIKHAVTTEKMSAKNLMRALLVGINHTITDKEYTKLTSEKEAILAAKIAKALDLRTIIQADRLRKQEGNENVNTKTISEEVFGEDGLSE